MTIEQGPRDPQRISRFSRASRSRFLAAQRFIAPQPEKAQFGISVNSGVIEQFTGQQSPAAAAPLPVSPQQAALPAQPPPAGKSGGAAPRRRAAQRGGIKRETWTAKTWRMERLLRQRVSSFVKANGAPVKLGVERVARNLRKSQLRKRYVKLLELAHSRIFDRKLETLFFVPTLQRAAPPADANGSSAPAMHYEGPLPRLAFDWAMSAAPYALKDYAFVDFQAGRGRAVLLAAQRRFEKIIGYEYDGQTFDDLMMNVAQFPRSLMGCRNVQCVRGDREGLTIPAQPSILFFSHALKPGFLSLIMTHVLTSYQLDPRRLYVMLENPAHSLSIGQDDIFYRITPPLPQRLQLKLFSPVNIAIYRSLA